MAKSTFSLKQRWRVNQPAPSYYCTFGDMIKGSQAELLTCNYEGKLKAYNVSGTEILTMAFSASILFFFIEHGITGAPRDVITLDVDGNVAVFPLQAGGNANTQWSLNLSNGLVAATTGQFTGRGEVEIACGLEGRRIVLIDEHGTIITDFTSPGGEIMSITGGDFEGDGQQELIIVDNKGVLFIRHRDGTMATVPITTSSRLVNSRKIQIRGVDCLLLLCKANEIYIATVDGNILLQGPQLGGDISAIATGKFSNQEKDDVAICFEDGTLAVYEPVLPEREQDILVGMKGKKERGMKSSASDLVSKIQRIVAVSKRISLEMMRGILKLDIETFHERIVEWANQFCFKIDGDYLVLDANADMTGFIVEMDKQFGAWESNERTKSGKK